MSNYSDLLKAVEQYYGAGSDEWAEIAKYGIASDKAEQILKQVPGVDIWVNANGSVRSYNYTPIENITSGAEQAINSNVPAEIKSFEIPSNSGIETITTETGETVKQMTFKSGMKQAGKFVFGEVTPAVCAAATGITLGKTIDSLLYNANPDFWDEHGMSTLDPSVWGDIIGTDSFGGRVLNMILGITPDGKTQAYMDENALAYMALYLNNKGIFNSGEETYSTPGEEYKDKFNNYNSIKNLTLYNIPSGAIFYQSSTDPANTQFITVNSGNPNIFLFSYAKSPNEDKAKLYVYTVSEKPYSITYNGTGDLESKTKTYNPEDLIHCTPNGQDILNDFYTIFDGTWYTYESTCKRLGIPYTVVNAPDYDDWKAANDLLALTKYGKHNIEHAIDGVGDQDNAKTPDLSNATTVQEALDALKEQYPELFDKAVTQDVVQPDGSTVTYTYVPIAVPELDPEGNPISSPALDPEGNPIGSTQAFPQIDPATAPEPLLKLITTLIQRDPPVNPPDTGSGYAPAVVPPSGSASALYAIYNPTLAQINAFGAWLWSDNFVDQIKKLFNDPMQAIIGLHKVYATPATSGSQNIKVGYLDSGVSAKVVSNQYTTIDCGTVRLSEQFHNVFDYSPYTEVSLYLPFIGIVNINVSDVMRSSIHIVYHVDVLSGACLAEVKVTRDSAGGTLYQYAGNASVTLPISSGSYMGIVSAVAGVAGGIAGTIASGGAALPLIASSAGAMFNAHTRVEHSGGFSGNAGAMGGKIPYLIISRPQTEMADGFENYIGYPSNFTATIGTCTGFIKVIECHIENTTATNSELTEINTMLQEGVIV